MERSSGGGRGKNRADFHFPLEIRKTTSKSEVKTHFIAIFGSFKDFRDLNFLPSSCFPDTYYFLETFKKHTQSSGRNQTMK